GGEEHGAEQFFVDVGARAQVPAIDGLDGVPYLVNSSLLELDALPEHLVVVGGSYVGLEFAQLFHRFGSRVMVVESAPRLGAAGADWLWALGDCNGRGAFTHTAYNDFEIVAANLLDGGDRKVSDRVPAWAVFIDPPLGRCGMSEREVRASGRRALIGKIPMK